ncbi:uncharacterized protein LOC113378126 [Ctenocephalides felis]|nr:uncharacterized protein LOC113378126 [Ctenocephalides felis]
MNIEQNIGENDNVNASGVNNVINIVNSKHVHIGGLVNINVNEGDEKYKKRKNKKYRKSNIATSIQEDETVKALMSSDEKCTRVHMEIIKKHIGKNWRNVFRKLDYSNGEIEQLYIDYINEGISEVIHQGLVDWTQNNPDEATLGKICTVLWEENCCDVIERLIN